MHVYKKKKLIILTIFFTQFFLAGSLCITEFEDINPNFYNPEDYVVNLRELRKKDLSDGFFNLDHQVERAANKLRGSESSFVIVGPLGSGKTEIIKRIAGDLGRVFGDKTPLLLDVVRLHDAVALKSALLNLHNLVRFVGAAKDYHQQKLGGDVVIIIDNLQLLLDAGQGQGDAVKNMFENEHMIALTTPDRFAKSGVARDKAFRRRVRILQIEEPSYANTVALALRFAQKIQREKQIVIPRGLVELAVKMAIVHVHWQAVPRTVEKMVDYAASQVAGADSSVSEVGMDLAIATEARMQPREVRSAKERVTRLDDDSFDRIIADRNTFNRMQVFEFNFDADGQYKEFRRNIRDGLTRGSYKAVEAWSSL